MTVFPRIGAKMPLAGLALAALVAVAPFRGEVLAQETPRVLAKIGDVEITETELDFAAADLAQQFAQVPEEQRRAAVLNALLDIRALAAKAEEEGMGEDATFKARMDFLRARALHNTYFQEKALKSVTDEDVRARYEKEIAAMPKEQEIRARHILVKTKEEAEEIIKQLDGGGDFSALATEKSLDSGADGGDLGFFGKGRMVKEFEDAAFALAKGEYTKTPVQTQFGFHVIVRDDERMSEPPPFDQVSGQVQQIVIQERYGEMIEAVRGAAKIEVLDETLRGQLEAAGRLK
jgi:peptidyl-prolyl cis-trans isomerase C